MKACFSFSDINFNSSTHDKNVNFIFLIQKSVIIVFLVQNQLPIVLGTALVHTKILEVRNSPHTHNILLHIKL